MSSWLLWLALAGAQETEEPAEAAEPAEAEASGTLEFDDRVVRGERAAGAVVLFDRAPRALPALVPVRRDFRQWIVEPVFGDTQAEEPAEVVPEPVPVPEPVEAPAVEDEEPVE